MPNTSGKLAVDGRERRIRTGVRFSIFRWPSDQDVYVTASGPSSR